MAVQFRGKRQVVDAYEANDMAPWSVWCGPQNLMFAYEGNDIGEGKEFLTQTLDKLKSGGSEAAYTLKVYDDQKKGSKISTVTPASRSFNFGVFDQDGEDTPYHKRQMSTMGALENRFNQMQDKWMQEMIELMDEKKKEKEAPEPVGGIAGLINGLLDTPGVKEALAAKVIGLFGMGPAIGQAPAQVAGIQQGDPEMARISPQEYQLLEQAIAILATHDKKIGTHLMGLAVIARDSPAKYKMALTFL